MTDVTAIRARVVKLLGQGPLGILESYLPASAVTSFYSRARAILDDYNRFPDKPLAENLYINLIKLLVQVNPYPPTARAGKAYDILMQLDLEDTVEAFIKEQLIDKRGLEMPGIRIYRYQV